MKTQRLDVKELTRLTDEKNKTRIDSSPVTLETQTDEVETVPLKARVY